MHKLRFFIVFMLIFAIFSYTASGVLAYAPSFEVKAGSVIIENLDTGNIVYEKNPDEKVYPASTTKIMTAILVFENVKNLDEPVTISETAFDGLIAAGSTASLKKGEVLTVRQLLYCLLVVSANEAANILGEHVAGNVDSFVEMMNTKAKELGLTSTHFTNPHGLHYDDHYTTARDTMLIAKHAASIEGLLEITNTTTYTLPKTNLSEERVLRSTDLLITKGSSYYYNYAKGVKTGRTTKAGNCLVSMAKKDGMNYIAVVMNDPLPETGNTNNAFIDTKNLYEWVFDSFSIKTLVKSGEIIGETNVDLSQKTDHVSAVIKDDLTALIYNDIDTKSLKRDITLEKSVLAPVAKGDELGKMTISFDGITYGTVSLVASNEVERSSILYVLYVIKSFFENKLVRIITVVVIVIVLLYIIIAWFLNKRKRKLHLGGRRSSRYISRRR